MNAKQLTAAETIVMKCIWDADHEMSLAEIVKNANEGYGKEATDGIHIPCKTLYQKLYPDETCWKNHYL